MEKILVVGTNAVKQTLLSFGDFQLDSINRASQKITFASGKGINFARVTKRYNYFLPHVIHFLGGDNGIFISKELDIEGIEYSNILIDDETRGATSCVDLKNHTTTEIIEPTPSASTIAIKEFEMKALELISQDDFIGLAICGTLIGGATTANYIKLLLQAEKSNKIILMDCYKDMSEIFVQLKRNMILKLNKSEICDFMQESNPEIAMKKAKELYNFIFIAITDGPENAILLDENNQFYYYTLPILENVINPIGAGDSASAVLLSEYLKSKNSVLSFKMALAVASSSCLSLKNGEINVDFARSYADKIVCISKNG